MFEKQNNDSCCIAVPQGVRLELVAMSAALSLVSLSACDLGLEVGIK